MQPSSFVIRPLDPTIADRLRQGTDRVVVADESPGYPCRRCLRDAAVGDELVLVSHDPFTRSTPYRSAGPIFVHREPCEPDADASTLPVQLTSRQLSVRSFDADEMMIDAAVIDGADLESTILRFFDDADSTRLHVHNAGRGCWAAAVDRI